MKIFGRILRNRLGALPSLARNRRGNAMAVAAAALPVLVGAMGLGVDYTQWVLWKRNLQGAADAAAVAAAQSLARGVSWADVQADATRLINGNASDTAIPRAQTQINRFQSPGQVFAAGQSAATNGTSVEIQLEAPGRLYFAGLFLANQPTIRSRAVAGPRGFGRHCFIGLSPTAAQAVRVWGSANVTTNCGVISNSNAADAEPIGGSASLTTTDKSAVGTVVRSGSATLTAGTITSGSPPQPDPFGPEGRNLQRPACASYSNIPSSGNVSPGCYNASSFNPGGNMTMAKGVYVFHGNSTMTINGNISIDGSAGVSLVMTGGANMRINGNADVNLRAMETSQAATEADAARRALAGVVIWQADASSAANRFNGNAAVTLNGAVYTPHTPLEISGSFSAASTCVQLVALTLNLTGNANFPNTCPSNDPNFRAFDTMRVVLAE